MTQWREGPHGATADCLACHGDRHGALPSSRPDSVRTGCHGGGVAHSYTTSKHGVLVGIGGPDWTRPLRRGEYRAPGCAYCHLNNGDHGDTMDRGRGPPARDGVCGASHAPRYVAQQLAAGDRLVAIARFKEQEAPAIAVRHPEGHQAVADLMATLRQHLRNVRLGAGHQSPDYQGWHGQPALDGDLIRLRDAVTSARRPLKMGAGPTEAELVEGTRRGTIGVKGSER